jgi:hypothetical protein
MIFIFNDRKKSHVAPQQLTRSVPPIELLQAQQRARNAIWGSLNYRILAAAALDLYESKKNLSMAGQVLAHLVDYMRYGLGRERWADFCDEIEELCDDHDVMLYVTGQEKE